MCVDDLADRHIDDWLVEDHQLGVLVHAEALLWLWNVAHGAQEPPELLVVLGNVVV